jgi:agmatine deiminase
MITDWETHKIMVSHLLPERQPEVYRSLLEALGREAVALIPDTLDIWCRDYMPVQTRSHRFVQFTYKPDYLKKEPHLRTPPEVCRLPFMTNYVFSTLIVDGGNVVSNGRLTIMTEKVFSENPDLSRSEVISQLETLLETECLFVPVEKGDIFGHTDGMVRFVSENVVVMNDYSTIDPKLGQKIHSELEKRSLDIELLPYVPDETIPSKNNDVPPAIGVYVNFLRVGNLVLMPVFGLPEDELALRKIESLLPGVRVIPVSSFELALEGGVLNCITWNY